MPFSQARFFFFFWNPLDNYCFYIITINIIIVLHMSFTRCSIMISPLWALLLSRTWDIFADILYDSSCGFLCFPAAG